MSLDASLPPSSLPPCLPSGSLTPSVPFGALLLALPVHLVELQHGRQQPVATVLLVGEGEGVGMGTRLTRKRTRRTGGQRAMLIESFMASTDIKMEGWMDGWVCVPSEYLRQVGRC